MHRRPNLPAQRHEQGGTTRGVSSHRRASARCNLASARPRPNLRGKGRGLRLADVLLLRSGAPMSETFLTVGGTPSVRAVLKTMWPYRGIGVTRLLFTFEFSCKQQLAVGQQLSLGGRIEISGPTNGSRLYLASFQSPSQLLTLPQLGVDQTLQMSMEVSERQMQLIEDSRTRGVEFHITLAGYAVKDGQQQAVSEAQIFHEIGQSEWLTLLERAGYRRRLLIELEPPDRLAFPDLALAIDYYHQAQLHYQDGEWRLTVESLRQCLASLVGKKADDEEQEADVEASIRALRKESRSIEVAYAPRLELVRQVTKFMCDLGAHPEVAETRRHHAYGALVIVGGLLSALTKE
jgi:hypothetical protein